MADQLNVHSMIAAEAAVEFEESTPFIMGIDRSREKEFSKNTNGYKIGDSVNISIPGVGQVYDGATLAGGGTVPDWVEKTVPVKVDIHKHAPFDANVIETMFKLPADNPNRKEYIERVFRPQVRGIMSAIEAEMLNRAMVACPNVVGTPGTVPTSAKVYNQARSVLQRYLTPGSGRKTIFSTDANTELVDASKQLFNPNADIAKQFRESYIGRFAQTDFFEAVNLPNLVTGNKVTGVTVSGAGQTGSALNIGGLTIGDTFKKGQTFTCGIKQVHPLTGIVYSNLQSFVITADYTATGTTGQLQIYPEIQPVFPNKTVDASPANGASLVFFHAASTTYRQNLMFAPGAFTAAFFPAPIVAGSEGSVFSEGGISLSVQTGGAFNNLTSTTRIDVLAAFAAPRGIMACRITE